MGVGSCWPRALAGAGWASVGALPLSSALCPAPVSVAPACFVTFPVSPLSLLAPSSVRAAVPGQQLILSASGLVSWYLTWRRNRQTQEQDFLLGRLRKSPTRRAGLLIQRELALLLAGGLQVLLEAQARWTEHPSTV